MLVKIDTELWWFKADLTTLEKVPIDAATTAENVAITDTSELYDATEVETAFAEIMNKHNVLQEEVTEMGVGTLQTSFTINLTAQSSVAVRVAAATETIDYPTGWTLSANSSVNLLVTHNLTGRKVSFVNVFEIDGSNERLLQPFSSAYSGILVNGLTVLIEGLAPTLLAVRIEILTNL